MVAVSIFIALASITVPPRLQGTYAVAITMQSSSSMKKPSGIIAMMANLRRLSCENCYVFPTAKELRAALGVKAQVCLGRISQVPYATRAPLCSQGPFVSSRRVSPQLSLADCGAKITQSNLMRTSQQGYTRSRLLVAHISWS
jgi:hypothetical protein